MIARKYKIGAGSGSSVSPLVAFDKALLDSGVGNYNLVRLSSILPAYCKEVDKVDIEEGSLLPIAYSTISSNVNGERIVSTIGVGFSDNEDRVGLIMEYSTKNTSVEDALETLKSMIKEGFENRGWKLKSTSVAYATDVVRDDKTHTTFACIAEW